MTNQTNRNNGSNNATALETALEGIIKNCTNIVKLADMEKLAIGTSCEGEYVCSSENITEQLQQAKEEVERLESIISECEEAKRKTEEAKKKENEQEEKFLDSLTASGKEVLSYLEGLQTLARGESLTLVENLTKIFKKYAKGIELMLTANLAAYVAILVKEEKKEVIDLLESITMKVDKIRCTSNVNEERVVGLLNILLAVQDIY